jgi:glycosyltransferase involved in cell wall biosynthesis
MDPVVSIVAPAYNEAKNLAAFVQAITPILDGLGEPWEIVFVDDGSRDDTLGLLLAARAQDSRIKIVGLARNFGKDVALSAGLAHARGRAVIPIDCDLQHPPSLIPDLVARWRAGADMVIALRTRRTEEGFVRRTTAGLYYSLMRRMSNVDIPRNAGDFRLLDRKIVDVINQMPERCRFMKGIFAWPGFKTETVEFQASARAGGRSTWSVWKLWRFALDGLFSFSTVPLKLWTYLGAGFATAAFIYLVITLVQKIVFGIAAPGYASLLIVLLFFGGLLLLSNGIQGEYIARIFEEVKGRPLFVVAGKWGFDDAAVRAPSAAASATSPGAAAPNPADATPDRDTVS